MAARGKGWLKARAIKGVGRWYARKRRHRSMSRKMEGYKRGGEERGGRGRAGFPSTDAADTPAREAVMRY